jgi:ABC-2 type transport system permease protein
VNLIKIIVKELKQNFRNWRTSIMLILFPIVLMAVLGTALSGVFNNTVEIRADAQYSVHGSGPVVQAFETFRTSVEPMGVRFTRVEESADTFSEVRDLSLACYLIVSDQGIILYKNSRAPLEADIIQSMLTVFLGRFNTAVAVAPVRPDLLKILAAGSGDTYVETTSLGGNRRARAIDYYAVTVLSFVVMFASVFGLSSIKREQRLRTADRMLSAPVRRWQILAGKIIGGLAVTSLQIAAALLFSRYVLGAYWGDDMATVGILLGSEVLMTASLGAGTAFLIKNEGAANGLLNTLGPVLATLGGSFNPLSTMGPAFQRIADFDPLAWVNRAILGVIYEGDYSAVFRAVAFCAGISIVFLAITAILSRKETA